MRPEDSSTVTHSEAEVPPTADANTANPARRSIELVDEGEGIVSCSLSAILMGLRSDSSEWGAIEKADQA